MSQFFKSAFRNPNSAIKFGFGDALFAVYLVVLVRQWFWPLDNAAAWALTVPLALAGWCFYVWTERGTNERLPKSFWLVVALPLLFVYALRAPFPDASFDVWSLRLFHGERGLSGFIYRPGEFFPTAAPFNPTPDMVTAVFRHALGYRLGTVVNLLALLWAGTILDRLLRPFVRRALLRSACVLLVLFAEHLLFEINNYMPDLLALPLMLEATRLTLDAREWESKRSVVVRVAFLVGVSVAFKLSNAALALPLVLVCAWRALAARPLKLKATAADALACLLVFAAPLVPFMVWVYGRTGSPVFPIYNGYFRSPLYLPSNGWDSRWGGFGAREILAWPVLMFFEPQRTAELGVYSGRLTLGFVVALACLLFARRADARTRTLVFVIVPGTLLWSLTMGYIRYGLYLEVLSGVLLVIIASKLFGARADEDATQAARVSSSESASSTARAPTAEAFGTPTWKKALAALVCAILVAQSVLAGFYVSRQEWSMRPTAFDDFGAYADEARYLLRDRSIRALLSDEDRERFDRVGLWVVSGSKTAGLIPFLNDRAPVVGVRSAGIFAVDASRAEFARTLDLYEGRRMYSLAFPEDYEDALKALHVAGLRGGRPETITFPFFAPSHPVLIYFFEVTREGDAATPARTQDESRDGR